MPPWNQSAKPKQTLRSQSVVHTVGLPVILQDLNVHGREDATQDLSGFVSTVFVAGMDGAGLPVGPVQSLFRQCQCEWMGQCALHHRLAAGEEQQESLPDIRIYS